MHVRKIMQEYTPNTENAIHKKRVCAYARVSSIRDEAFHSLSSQVSYYQQKIAEHPDWEYVEVFSDRGITGTKDDRPGFQAMLTACREGKVDIVLAKSITRFARNTVILLETVRELKKLGVDIHFEEERIETLGMGGEFMISILAARAQEESRSASENQLWRIKKSYEQGIPVTGNCLGYRMVNHQFLIDEEEEKLVQRIFSMYLSGMGCVAIAKTLTKEGIKTLRESDEWYAETIARILHNEKYCGDLILQKKYRIDHITKKLAINRGEKPMYEVRDAHDPIISREAFMTVQEEFKRRQEKFAPKNSIAQHIFTGLIRCGKCHRLYCRYVQAPNTPHEKTYWVCGRNKQYGKETCDAGWKIPEDILMQKTCEVLDIDNFNETLLRELVKVITVTSKNELVFCFQDGSEKSVEWHHRSRRESWTQEMKEAARQKSLALKRAKKKGENPNGA